MGKTISDIDRIICPAFIAPTLQNSWVNYDTVQAPAGYFKDIFGVVHLRGMIKSGTMTATAFTLPTGFRPTFEETMVTTSNSAYGRVIIKTDGSVVPQDGSNVWFSLNGITFRAST